MLVLLGSCGRLSLDGTAWCFLKAQGGSGDYSGYADCTISFSADSFTVTNGEHSGSGSYELSEDGTKVYLNTDGDILTVTINADTLIIEIGDETVFFMRCESGYE